MAELLTEQEINAKAEQIMGETSRFFAEIEKAQGSGSGVGGFITIPNVFKNDRTASAFRQLLDSTKDFGTGDAPVALTSPEAVVLFRSQVDENDVSKFPSKIFDPNNIVFFDGHAVLDEQTNEVSSRGLDNFRDNLTDLSKDNSVSGDIAYIAEMYLAEANGERLTKTQKDFRKEFLTQYDQAPIRSFYRDVPITEALMMQEYLRTEKGIYTELQPSVDSGQASIVFSNIHDMTMATVRDGRSEDEHFNMMRQCTKEIGMIDDNGSLRVTTQTELKQDDSFTDSKMKLERELKSLLDSSARSEEARRRLAIVQHELIVLCEKIAKEKENRRVERNRRLAKEEEERNKAIEQEKIDIEKAREEAEAEARRIRDYEKVSIEGPDSPIRQRANTVEFLMATTLVSAAIASAVAVTVASEVGGKAAIMEAAREVVNKMAPGSEYSDAKEHEEDVRDVIAKNEKEHEISSARPRSSRVEDLSDRDNP